MSTPPTPEPLKVTIDAAELKRVFSDAILQSLSTEVRNGLIGQALENLLKPIVRSDGYGRNTQFPSPLEDAFNNAVREVAAREVREFFALPENAERVRALCIPAIEQLFQDDDLQYSNNIAAAIADSILSTLRKR